MENQFAKNLEYLRKNKLVIVSELEELLGISKSTWNNWEKGRALPRMEVFLKLVQFINTTETALLHNDLEAEAAQKGLVAHCYERKLDYGSGNNKELTLTKEQIALLKKNIEDKEQVIELLKEKIKGLEAEKKFLTTQKTSVAKASGNKL